MLNGCNLNCELFTHSNGVPVSPELHLNNEIYF